MGIPYRKAHHLVAEKVTARHAQAQEYAHNQQVSRTQFANAQKNSISKHRKG